MEGTLFVLLCSISITLCYGDHKKFQDWFLHESDISKFSLNSKYLPEKDEVLKAVHFQLTKSPKLIPVVIVPSLIGNRLEAALNKTNDKHWYCWKDSSWYTIFFDTYEEYPFFYDCWTENMQIEFNPKTSQYSDVPGVETRAPGYGETTGIDFVDDNKKSPIWYYYLEALISVGYTPGFNLLGAPYDWRQGPTSFVDEFQHLKNLIEETYVINENTSVAIISLSMGSNFFTLFCNTFVSQEWKSQYIHSFTSLSGAFGGSTFAATTTISLSTGYNLDSKYSSEFQQMVSSWGSVFWLLPTYEAFGESVFIIDGNGYGYSPLNFSLLVEKANITYGLEMLESMNHLRNFTAPGVPVNCLYGYNISTLNVADFTQGFYEPYTNTTSDGDGTCLHQSLAVCEDWIHQQNEPVNVYPIANMLHGDALYNAEAITLFLKSLGF